MRFFRFLQRNALILVVGLLAAAPSQAVILWYNGDFDDSSGLANERNTFVTDAYVYDDFNVTAPGWTIDTIWSNDLMDFIGVTQADWFVRSGVSAGNGGTIVASGTSPATQVPTGRSGFGLVEYTIQVSGLSIDLSPGTYWLAVAPVGFGSGRSFISTTSGANAVGTPPGNNGNSFFDSTFFGANFEPSSNFVGPDVDFSMGVAGNLNSAPEPASLILVGIGIAGVVVARRKARARALSS